MQCGPVKLVKVVFGLQSFLRVESDMLRCSFDATTLHLSEEARNPSTHLTKVCSFDILINNLFEYLFVKVSINVYFSEAKSPRKPHTVMGKHLASYLYHLYL